MPTDTEGGGGGVNGHLSHLTFRSSFISFLNLSCLIDSDLNVTPTSVSYLLLADDLCFQIKKNVQSLVTINHGVIAHLNLNLRLLKSLLFFSLQETVAANTHTQICIQKHKHGPCAFAIKLPQRPACLVCDDKNGDSSRYPEQSPRLDKPFFFRD